MKLLFVIISKEDVDQVISGLNKEGFRATKIASSGGFLKKKKCDFDDWCAGRPDESSHRYCQRASAMNARR